MPSLLRNDVRAEAAVDPLVPRLCALICLACLVTVSGWTPLAYGQQRPIHYFHSADMPPGSIGRGQLLRGGPLPGYYQPVEISVPQGAQLSLAVGGVFEPTEPGPAKAGMLIGQVYRLKVTNIPQRPGQEVFPSVEVINRLYPPPGQETRFPIPIQITREELELALRGQFVIRVIYLEDPITALPRREDPGFQRYFDVGSSQDPLQVADGLGRPMAILRLGSRVPDVDQTTGRFLFDSPPWMRYPEIITPEVVPQERPEPVNQATAISPARADHGRPGHVPAEDAGARR